MATGRWKSTNEGNAWSRVNDRIPRFRRNLRQGEVVGFLFSSGLKRRTRGAQMILATNAPRQGAIAKRLIRAILPKGPVTVLIVPGFPRTGADRGLVQGF